MNLYEMFFMCHTPCAYTPYQCALWNTPGGLLLLSLLTILVLYMLNNWNKKNKVKKYINTTNNNR